MQAPLDVTCWPHLDVDRQVATAAVAARMASLAVVTPFSALSVEAPMSTRALVILMGTPSGVGHARRPPLWMKDGDIVEVEIENVGLLRNPVKDEAEVIA